MPKLSEIAHHVRSKVAGPFWVTMDVFFPDRAAFDRWHGNAAIGAESIARIYDVPAGSVAIYPVASLNMVKISYPRARPQGGTTERDLHSGQQFAYLLDVEMA